MQLAGNNPLGAQLAAVLAQRSVRTVFQPIVDLDSRQLVAFEALTRGPLGPLERPELLFAVARAADRLPELEQLCQQVALTSALAADIAPPLRLFVNIEPEAVDERQLGDLAAMAAAAGIDIVVEVTERAISARPAELLATVQTLRSLGVRIALDDIGPDEMSLAFMPLLQPDIVKLDLTLVQQRPDTSVAKVVHAVSAYAEAHQAVILAEGIETEAHVTAALALGARLGQGMLFGFPSPTAETDLEPGELRFSRTFVGATESPFASLPARTPIRRSSRSMLGRMSRSLEREAARLGRTALVLSTFQHAEIFTPAIARRYAEIADRVGFVAVFGDGMPTEPTPGVHGVALCGTDDICREWDVVVVAPHFTAALLAREVDSGRGDAGRVFDFALTYDRETVIAAAISLMSRVTGRPSVTALSPPVRADVPPAAATDRPQPTRHVVDKLAEARRTRRAVGLLVVEVHGTTGGDGDFGPQPDDAVVDDLADRLRRACRPSDDVVHVGGDEFLVVLSGLRIDSAAVDARNAADALRRKVQEPMLTTEGVTVYVTVDIGVSVYPDDGADAEQLLHRAAERAVAAKVLRRPSGFA